METASITQLQQLLVTAQQRRYRKEKNAFWMLLTSAFFLSLFAFFLLDYFTRFPWPVRVLISLIIIGGCVVYLPRRFGRKIRKEKDVLAVAREIEKCAATEQTGGLNSVLISAIEFGSMDHVLGSQELKNLAIQEAHAPESSPLNVPLHNRTLVKVAMRTLAVFVVVYGLWAALGTEAMGAFFARAIGLSKDYPTNTDIADIQYPHIVAEHKDAQIVVKASGLVPSQGRLIVKLEGESPFTLPLVPASAENAFVGTIKEIPRSLKFHVKLGDARSRRLDIRVVKAPYVKTGTITVTPPAYTGGGAAVHEIGNLEMVQHSKVAFEVVPDREIQTCLLTLQEGAETTEHAFSHTGDRLRLELAKTPGTCRYSIKMIDLESIENEDRLSFGILVLKDKLPQVKLEKPKHGNYYAPVSTMNWTVKASDDYGMNRVALRYAVKQQNQSGEEVHVKSGAIPLSQLSGDQDASLDGKIDLLKLGFKPGMTVSLTATVSDNCSFRKQGEVGESPETTINIVSPEELRVIIQEEMLALNKLLKDVESDMKHQERIIDLKLRRK